MLCFFLIITFLFSSDISFALAPGHVVVKNAEVVFVVNQLAQLLVPKKTWGDTAREWWAWGSGWMRSSSDNASRSDLTESLIVGYNENERSIELMEMGEERREAVAVSECVVEIPSSEQRFVDFLIQKLKRKLEIDSTNDLLGKLDNIKEMLTDFLVNKNNKKKFEHIVLYCIKNNIITADDFKNPVQVSLSDLLEATYLTADKLFDTGKFKPEQIIEQVYGGDVNVALKQDYGAIHTAIAYLYRQHLLERYQVAPQTEGCYRAMIEESGAVDFAQSYFKLSDKKLRGSIEDILAATQSYFNWAFVSEIPTKTVSALFWPIRVGVKNYLQATDKGLQEAGSSAFTLFPLVKVIVDLFSNESYYKGLKLGSQLGLTSIVASPVVTGAAKGLYRIPEVKKSIEKRRKKIEECTAKILDYTPSKIDKVWDQYIVSLITSPVNYPLRQITDIGLFIKNKCIPTIPYVSDKANILDNWRNAEELSRLIGQQLRALFKKEKNSAYREVGLKLVQDISNLILQKKNGKSVLTSYTKNVLIDALIQNLLANGSNLYNILQKEDPATYLKMVVILFDTIRQQSILTRESYSLHIGANNNKVLFASYNMYCSLATIIQHWSLVESPVTTGMRGVNWLRGLIGFSLSPTVYDPDTILEERAKEEKEGITQVVYEKKGEWKRTDESILKKQGD
ncbi:hypothetical protein KKC59_04735, partial [bacterium]|nr:hypothetical protein [bacterium]